MVHPRVGVWIEMMAAFVEGTAQAVHPRVGVWIEINMPPWKKVKKSGSPPCGGVD